MVPVFLSHKAVNVFCDVASPRICIDCRCDLDELTGTLSCALSICNVPYLPLIFHGHGSMRSPTLHNGRRSQISHIQKKQTRDDVKPRTFHFPVLRDAKRVLSVKMHVFHSPTVHGDVSVRNLYVGTTTNHLWIHASKPNHSI